MYIWGNEQMNDSKSVPRKWSSFLIVTAKARRKQESQILIVLTMDSIAPLDHVPLE